MSPRRPRLPLSLAASLALTLPAMTAHAGWRSDPACAASQQPGTARTFALSGLTRSEGQTDWVEPWADWWSACVTESAEATPALCRDGEEERVNDKAGRCMVFSCRGGTFDIRACPDPTGLAPVPRVASVTLFADGYAALVEHKRGSKEEKLRPADLPLAHALRALMGRSRLPSDELTRVPAAFWQRLPRVAVVERSKAPLAAATHVVAASGGR